MVAVFCQLLAWSVTFNIFLSHIIMQVERRNMEEHRDKERSKHETLLLVSIKEMKDEIKELRDSKIDRKDSMWKILKSSRRKKKKNVSIRLPTTTTLTPFIKTSTTLFWINSNCDDSNIQQQHSQAATTTTTTFQGQRKNPQRWRRCLPMGTLGRILANSLGSTDRSTYGAHRPHLRSISSSNRVFAEGCSDTRSSAATNIR